MRLKPIMLVGLTSIIIAIGSTGASAQMSEVVPEGLHGDDGQIRSAAGDDPHRSDVAE